MRLPYNATIFELVCAIEETQRRCRVGLCKNPVAMAQKVTIGIERACLMARALNIELRDLFPEGVWYEDSGNWNAGSLTMVQVRSPWFYGQDSKDVELEVLRSGPQTSTQNGCMKFTLRPPGVRE